MWNGNGSVGKWQWLGGSNGWRWKEREMAVRMVVKLAHMDVNPSSCGNLGDVKKTV
jgi:hypothetical protein